MLVAALLGRPRVVLQERRLAELQMVELRERLAVRVALRVAAAECPAAPRVQRVEPLATRVQRARQVLGVAPHRI